MKSRNLLILAAFLTLLLVLAIAARGQITQNPPLNTEGVIFEPNYRLTQTVEDDLVVVGQTLIIESGARVEGDAAFVGGDVTLDGAIAGDFTAIGSTLRIGRGARVEGSSALSGSTVILDGRLEGDVFVTADQLSIVPDARISGEVTACVDYVSDERANAGALLPCSDAQPFAPFAGLIALRGESVAVDLSLSPAATLLTMVVLAGLLAGISTLVVTVFPRQISHIEEAILAQPRRLGGAGFAAFLLLVGVTTGVIMLLALIPTLGLIVLPLYALLLYALLVLNVAGLITLALLIGEWLLRRFSRAPAPPLVAAFIGSLSLASAATLLTLLPFGAILGFAGVITASSIGLGAAMFTRLGTRPLRRTYFVQG